MWRSLIRNIRRYDVDDRDPDDPSECERRMNASYTNNLVPPEGAGCDATDAFFDIGHLSRVSRINIPCNKAEHGVV